MSAGPSRSESEEEKIGRKYVQTFECDDRSRVYKELADELIAKKLNECSWIRSIRREPLYNGFDHIYATYDHGVRRVYTVEH